MKKIILIALACTACLAMFGCQDNTTSQNESTTQIQTTALSQKMLQKKPQRQKIDLLVRHQFPGGIISLWLMTVSKLYMIS